MSTNPRLAAARALAAVLAGRASLSGSSLPTQLENVEPRDRGLAQELAFGSAALAAAPVQALAARLLQKPFKAADRDVQALLLVGLYQLLYTRIPPHAAIGETVGCADKLKKPWAKGLLNAVLRRAQRESEALLAEVDKDPAARLAHPRWLLKALKKAWPEQYEAICAANNAHPPMTLRVNRRHGEPRCLPGRVEPRRLRSDRLRVQPRRHQPRRSPATSANCPASPRAASACRTKPRNWPPSCWNGRPTSACSTPAARPAARPATCWRPSPDWLAWSPWTSKRAAWCACARTSHGLQLDAQLFAADARDTAKWWDGKPFQRILLDAPCSATGVIRRHPDIKLARTPEDIAALAHLQGELLDALWATLEVGGVLVYATCSVMPAENSDSIAAFLARTPGARELDLPGPWGLKQPHGRQLLPQQGGP